jgi:hypothetical protein
LSNPDIWQAVNNPTDDLRLALNSPYQDMGLIKEEKYQLISLKPEQLTKSQGDTLTITPSYNVSDADNTLSGIGVMIHFDSRKLAISENDITNIYSNGKQGNPLIRDEGQNESDHDSNTDKVIVFFWADTFSGNWPNQSLPLDLASIQFTVKNDADLGSCHINATASTLANGYEFTSTSADITIQEKEIPPQRYQTISLKPEQLTKNQGETLTITPSYNVSDSDNTLSGIGLMIHFDSRQLEISDDDLTNIYSNGKQGIPLIRDEGKNENDHDPNTDKVIVFFWSDPYNGNWPNQSLPLDLANVEFTIKNDAFTGSTHINATASTLANGYEFSSTSAEISIQEKEIPPQEYQSISLKTEQLTFEQGESLTITPEYNVSDADNTLSGMGVIIHFDSSKLEISENDITNIFSTGNQGTPHIRDEGQNENDHDSNTDKVIVFFWSDPFSGDWPNQSLPIDLANIQFTVINDAASGSTNINATASTLANGYEFTSTSAGVMIQAKETLPLVEWCSSSQSINEDAGNISLTACLSESTSTDVIIPYTVTGSAISGTDHNLSNGLLTILSGQTKASQVISIIDDTDVENSETIVISMGSPLNAEPGAITVHSITINDKDIPEITIIGDDYVNENSTSILTVQLDQPNPREDIEIQYQVNGTAVIDSDYSIEPESPLTISSGQTEVKLTITTLEDNDVEPNKTVILSLNNPTHADLGDASEHTVAILDNDSPQISWNVADQNVWEDVGAITITAQLDKTSFQAVTASFIVSGSDHDLQPGQIEIESGQISASTTFNIIPESECEADEAIKITLTNSQNANLGSIPLHTVYVQEICPNFVTEGDIERMEDCGQQTITAWASSITTGKPGPDSFGFIVETDNDTLFSVQPDISNDGNFTFTPKPDVSGSASVDVFLQVDDYYVSASKSFTIDILPVNDCPVFSMPKTYTINEDAGYQAFSNWVSNRSAGATDEASNQTLTLSVTDTTNSEMFEQTPLLNENGDLTFQVKKNANGNSVVTVELRDDGITDNNGCNSIEKTFNIVVKAINDPPVNTIRPDLSGVLQLDQTLTARKGLWNDDHDQSPGTITYTYQWEMADNQNGMNVSPIPGETENTLELVQSLFGKFIRLAVTASDDGEGKPIVQSATRNVKAVQCLPVYIRKRGLHIRIIYATATAA